MNNEPIRCSDSDELEKMQGIRNITPEGQNPILYWHQVAMDAIHAREQNEKRRKDDLQELERLKRYEQDEQNRKIRELSFRTMPDFCSLLNRVQNGDFSMNVQFSFYPNCDRKGDADYD